MRSVQIMHNPRCSKSRQALSIIEQQGYQAEIIEYLKNPLTLKQIKELGEKLGLPASAWVRKKEKIIKEIQLDTKDDEAILDAMAQHPIIIERPIVIKKNKAVIGRPPESVLELLD